MSLLINNSEYKSIHFVGILGSGMSAIAQYLLWTSCKISGSDRLVNEKSTQHIEKKFKETGCSISKQDGSGITSETDAIVVSTAIENSNPDISQALKLNIPVFHRSDVLSAIVATKKTIAVAGTSGKSTVSALLFHLLEKCHKKPSLITGANLHSLIDKGFIGNAFCGQSDLLIIEADESDGSLIKYHPYISLFLNLSKDHKPIEEILPLFSTLAGQSTENFVNRDDSQLNTIKSKHTFSTKNTADYVPDDVATGIDSASITKNTKTYSVPFPGKHMIANLTAALSICDFLKCDVNLLQKAAKNYQGIQRRFDRIMTQKRVVVIDDYAHNPEKIRAALETAQTLSETVFALFQPHGFKPTKFLLNEFIDMFNVTLRKSDKLFLLPIYYAGGTATKDVSSNDIAIGCTKCRGTIIVPKNRDDVLTIINLQAKSGDTVILMGARDPSLPDFAEKIAKSIDSIN